MQLKSKTRTKVFDASARRVGIAIAKFNGRITEAMLKNALRTLKSFKVKAGNIKVVRVPGSMELTFALQTLARSERYDALVALGCVIRGETPHFDYVCKMAQEGVLRVSLEHNIPIGFGVLTVNDLAQAKARIHLGGEACVAALELARLASESE